MRLPARWTGPGVPSARALEPGGGHREEGEAPRAREEEHPGARAIGLGELSATFEMRSV